MLYVKHHVCTGQSSMKGKMILTHAAQSKAYDETAYISVHFLCCNDRRKVQICTILGLYCANLGSQLCSCLCSASHVFAAMVLHFSAFCLQQHWTCKDIGVHSKVVGLKQDLSRTRSLVCSGLVLPLRTNSLVLIPRNLSPTSSWSCQSKTTGQ